MAADSTYPKDRIQLRHDGNLYVPSGKKIIVESGGIVNRESGAIDQDNGVAISRRHKVAKVALAALDTGGGILSWQNPAGVDIIIDRIVFDITTKSTGACTADIGTTPTSATTSSDNLMDGLDVGTAAGIFDNLGNAGTNGKTRQKLAAGKWVTGSMATGAAAGLVGNAYIYYYDA